MFRNQFGDFIDLIPDWIRIHQSFVDPDTIKVKPDLHHCIQPPKNAFQQVLSKRVEASIINRINRASQWLQRKPFLLIKKRRKEVIYHVEPGDVWWTHGVLVQGHLTPPVHWEVAVHLDILEVTADILRTGTELS